MPELRCEDYSWLLVSQCAHCRGEKLDPELEAVAHANVMGH